MKISLTNLYKESINYKYQRWALLFLFAIKMIVDNFAARCSSLFIIINIVMLFGIMTKQYFAKAFKTEEKKACLKSAQMINRLLRLNTT